MKVVMCQEDRQRQHVELFISASVAPRLSINMGCVQWIRFPFKCLCHHCSVLFWVLTIFIWFSGCLPIALCLFSASSSFRLRSNSFSGLELLAVVVSCLDLADMRGDFSDSSTWLQEIFMADWTTTELLTVLLLRLLHWELVWSGSVSVSSQRLSSELESLDAALSGVLLLLELLDGVAACTAGATAAVFKGSGFSVSGTTTEGELGDDCTTLVMETGLGVVWLTGAGATEADAMSWPGLAEVGVEGGTGAFLFFCWLSKPTPVCT